MKMLAELKVGKPGAAFLFPDNCAGFIDPDMFDAEIWKPGRETQATHGDPALATERPGLVPLASGSAISLRQMPRRMLSVRNRC